MRMIVITCAKCWSASTAFFVPCTYLGGSSSYPGEIDLVTSCDWGCVCCVRDVRVCPMSLMSKLSGTHVAYQHAESFR